MGALKPLLNRILVPSAGVGAGAGAVTSEDDLEAQESDEVEGRRRRIIRRYQS